MSKNFRKEGQPEKERIAQLTGLELDKARRERERGIIILILQVQEWFKNRRKKDKLIQSRVNSLGTPKGKRGRKLLLPHSVTRTQKNTTNTPKSSLSTTSTSKYAHQIHLNVIFDPNQKACSKYLVQHLFLETCPVKLSNQ